MYRYSHFRASHESNTIYSCKFSQKQDQKINCGDDVVKFDLWRFRLTRFCCQDDGKNEIEGKCANNYVVRTDTGRVINDSVIIR